MRNIMRSFIITSRSATRMRGMEPVQSVQINIYGSKWLHFDGEQGVQERQQGTNQQSYISISAVYLTYPSSCPDVTTIFHATLYGWLVDIKIKYRITKLNRTNQGSNVLGGSFNNGDNVKVPFQFRRETDSRSILQDNFSSKTDLSSFTSID